MDTLVEFIDYPTEDCCKNIDQRQKSSESLDDILQNFENKRKKIPKYDNGTAAPAPYKSYEGALQLGLERLLEQIKHKMYAIFNIYTVLENEQHKEIGILSINKDAPPDEEKKTYIKRLEEIKKEKELVSTHEKTFLELEKKLRTIPVKSTLPVVVCPTDLGNYRNLLLKKKYTENGNGPKVDAEVSVIDQILPQGQTYLDACNSPLLVYHLLKRFAKSAEEPGVRKLFSYVCRALELQFVGYKNEKEEFIPPRDERWNDTYLRNITKEIMDFWDVMLEERAKATKNKEIYSKKKYSAAGMPRVLESFKPLEGA